jgi:hypothetical protein
MKDLYIEDREKNHSKFSSELLALSVLSLSHLAIKNLLARKKKKKKIQ